MALPNNTLSTTVVQAAFMPPRTILRNTPTLGLTDYHYGGIALGDSSQGLNYQLWTVTSVAGSIWLSAPNTSMYAVLPGQAAIWVALAFDQNARVFIAWTADLTGNTFYYWFDTTIPGYRISQVPGVVKNVFSTLDDSRQIESSSNDIILAYTRLGILYYRQERDRFGVEYNLGTAPGKLVQLGMNHKLRLQFAFQGVTGNAGLPPQEWNPALGINEPA